MFWRKHEKTTGSCSNQSSHHRLCNRSFSDSQQCPWTTANQWGDTRFSLATNVCVTSNMATSSWAIYPWHHVRNLNIMTWLWCFCCWHCVEVDSHFEISSLWSLTVAHWKRRMENTLHLVCTNKCCSLPPAITEKTLSILFLYRHTHHC